MQTKKRADTLEPDKITKDKMNTFYQLKKTILTNQHKIHELLYQILSKSVVCPHSTCR